MSAPHSHYIRAEIIRQVRWNREMKRRRLNEIFDGVRPHRK